MLSLSQLTTLKADIQADPTLNAIPMGSDGSDLIASYYNLNAVPDFWVWRTAVAKTEYTSTVSAAGTSFAWTGAGFITRSVGERDAWRELFDEYGECNPSLPNVQQAFADIFSGTGLAAANRTHLTAISRRRASRAEKLFATGVGTTASPAAVTFEGFLSYEDVDQARSS